MPDASELARRDAEGVGLTAPELAVVMAHVKNHYKRLLAALPLTGYEWSRSLLAPYFPAALVASRDPLDHPLANAILATVLANEAINRCGPLMIGALAARHAVDETAVLLAWARGWAALQLGRLFEVLDAHALRVTPAASRERDLHARALQAAVVAGVLSMPEPVDGEGASSATQANLAQLTHLFDDQQFAPWRTSSSVPADDAFAVASQTVDGIESIADFVFSALAVDRPASMSLPTLLLVGVEVRRRTGIDALEQSLMHAAASPAQQALRGHALQVLRRAQQALLNRVLQEIGSLPACDPETGRKLDARMVLLPGAETGAVTADVDTAILRAWTLSEAILTTC